MKYVMLLRGMGPGDPKFNNQTVCRSLEKIGHSNVRSLQASGNYLFESEETDHAKLEADIEAAIWQYIGYQRAAVVRSADEIAELIKLDPFTGASHSESTYLLVTFMKRSVTPDFQLPHQPAGKPYTILTVRDGMIFSITDNTAIGASDLMRWLEKQFGKDVTSRTWNTLQRIHQKLTS